MALPVGVTTATITFGVPTTFTGAFVRSTVSIQPSATLVHTATGTPLINFIEDVITTEGTSGQFVLPHTDQTGFQDEAGNSYQNWYYTATVTYASDKGSLPARTKTFQLTSGQTVVDLDLLPAGAPVLPYTAQTATVTSFAGRTGAVTVQDSDLPARLGEGALNATIATATVGKLDSSKAVTTYAGISAAQPLGGTLADVQAIPNLKWLFSPETGFYSDVAGTTRQTTDGGAVRCWKDASGNNDHATNATGLTLAAGAAGGVAALNVNGSAQRLKTTGVFDSTFDAGFTTFVVAHNPTVATNQVIAGSQDGRWYTAWNGTNQGFGPVMSATALPGPKIPVDIPTPANPDAIRGSVMVEVLRYNGPSQVADFLYHGYPGKGTAATAATAPAITGVLNIGGLSGGFNWGGQILALVVFKRALTNAEVQRVYNYLAGVTRSRPRPLVQCIGNSLTSGTGATNNIINVPSLANMDSIAGYATYGDKDYPSQLLDMYPSGDVTIRVDSYPGRTHQQIAAELPRTTLTMYDPASHSKRIALVWEIVNDLGTNISANSDAIDAGTEPPAYTNFVNICLTLKNQGWIVGAFTSTPRSDLQNGAVDNPKFYRAYQHINNLIRKNWPTFASFLVDVGADPRIGLPGSELDLTYYTADKVHMNDEGYRVVASLVKSELDKWISSGKSAPTLTKSVAGGANVTLKPAEYGTITTTDGRGVLTLTGALTANIIVFLPLVNGSRALVRNNTTGAFTVTIRGIGTGTGGYALTQGKKAMLYTDGYDWFQGSAEF